MLKKAFPFICRMFPHRIAKTYLHPLVHSRRSLRPYDPKSFFESYYSLPNQGEDGHTVSPDSLPHLVRYHYNQVENSIIRFLAKRPGVMPINHVLDVGSGTGHWIGFYLDAFRALRVTGIEISTLAAQNLKERFPDERVAILNMDVEDAAPLPTNVDLINAVGVLFHLVDDAQLQRVVARLSSVLRPGGVFIISGLFGLINQNTQFHRQDNFSSWAETRALCGQGPLLVDKRVRSIFFWRKLLTRLDLKVVHVQRHRHVLPGPENNILFAIRHG